MCFYQPTHYNLNKKIQTDIKGLAVTKVNYSPVWMRLGPLYQGFYHRMSVILMANLQRKINLKAQKKKKKIGESVWLKNFILN